MREYCFRRKRHSYAACDAALAARNKNKSLRAVLSNNKLF